MIMNKSNLHVYEPNSETDLDLTLHHLPLLLPLNQTQESRERVERVLCEPAWVGSGVRCVPPHLQTVTLYTGRQQAGLGGQARRLGWGDCVVCVCVCFVRKDTTEDDDNDSVKTNYIIDL